jgi:hypothetical protein
MSCLNGFVVSNFTARAFFPPSDDIAPCKMFCYVFLNCLKCSELMNVIEALVKKCT